jgi:hypothetical protein
LALLLTVSWRELAEGTVCAAWKLAPAEFISTCADAVVTFIPHNILRLTGSENRVKQTLKQRFGCKRRKTEENGAGYDILATS